jgi:hypothetical protein
MTDFIDVLEQQLMTAHGRRPRRLAMPWRGGAALVATAAAAALVVALVVALASPDSHRGASPPAQQSPPKTTPVRPVEPTTIAVLNGTTVTGLGRDAANELTAGGYEAPNVVANDTTNQSRRRSEIFYEPGHKADAEGVAGCLHIGFDRITPMDANARALADRADVAVFIGADRAK